MESITDRKLMDVLLVLGFKSDTTSTDWHFAVEFPASTANN
jgi:hypothetical protein